MLLGLFPLNINLKSVEPFQIYWKGPTIWNWHKVCWILASLLEIFILYEIGPKCVELFQKYCKD